MKAVMSEKFRRLLQAPEGREALLNLVAKSPEKNTDEVSLNGRKYKISIIQRSVKN